MPKLIFIGTLIVQAAQVGTASGLNDETDCVVSILVQNRPKRYGFGQPPEMDAPRENVGRRYIRAAF